MRKLIFIFVLSTNFLSSQEILRIDNSISSISYSGTHFLHNWDATNDNITGLIELNDNQISKIGVIAKVKDFKDPPLSETMKMLEPEDLIKYGLIPEFIGRMPIIATLDDLDEKSLVKILLEPKNSLIKQYQRLFEFENVELEFKDEAINEVAKKAISKKTGARGLRSILENILLKTMFELPDMENVFKVTVDAATVKGASEPIITYGKKSSTSVA